MNLKSILCIGNTCLAAMILGTSMADACSPSTVHSGHHHAAATVVGSQDPFLAENASAMDKMMAGMAVKPTGDVGLDFVAMMIPHHQGAIDMAVAYLRYGDNPQLRRLAQEIIVEQQQEIAAMRLAVGQPLPPSVAVPTQVKPATADDVPAKPSSTACHKK